MQLTPDGIYTATQLCDLIPSAARGKRLHKATITKWVQKGYLKGHVGADGTRRFLGADVLEFLGIEAMPEWHGRTPAQRKRDIDAAIERLKAQGMEV